MSPFKRGYEGLFHSFWLTRLFLKDKQQMCRMGGRPRVEAGLGLHTCWGAAPSAASPPGAPAGPVLLSHS